jgi:hypothetical protein
VDDVQAGVRAYVTGEHVETFTYQATLALTGSQTAAFATDLTTGLISPSVAAGTLIKTARAARLTRLGAVSKAINELDDALRLSRTTNAIADLARIADNIDASNGGFYKLIDEGISGIDDVIESRYFRELLANDPTARRLYLRLRQQGVDVVLDHRFTPGNLAGEVVQNAVTGKPQINIYLSNNSSTQKALGTFLHETRHAEDILRGRTTFAGGNSLQLEARAIRRERIWELGRKLTRDEWKQILWDLDVPGSGLR